MKTATTLLIAIISTGCAHTNHPVDAFTEPFPRVDFPAVEEGLVEAGWCEEAKPLAAGSEATCLGILLPPHKLDLLMREADLLYSAEKALAASYEGREADRRYAEEIIATREEQLRIAKEMQPKMFAVGVGAGAGATLLAVIAALLGTR